jgi:hypothetical protein
MHKIDKEQCLKTKLVSGNAEVRSEVRAGKGVCILHAMEFK